MTQRHATWEQCGGRCVGCNRRVSRTASSWVWQAHHVIKQQWLRSMVRQARIRDATFTVVLCRRCHERHENPGVHDDARVPLEKLPRAVVERVDDLGSRASYLLRRYHPETTT